MKRCLLSSFFSLIFLTNISGPLHSQPLESKIARSGVSCNLEQTMSFGCGITHGETKYSKGKTEVKVYVPEGGTNTAILDRLSCIIGNANAKFQEACSEGEAPSLSIIRGVRPESDASGIEIKYDPAAANVQGAKAFWSPNENSITFGDAESWSCPPLSPSGQAGTHSLEQDYHRTIVAHEFGHAFGLCHDACTAGVGGPGPTGPSFMREHPSPGMEHRIDANHCAAIQAANCETPSSGGPSGNLEYLAGRDCTCFYCQVPRFQDLCDRLDLPIACGGPINPPAGETCYHILHTTVLQLTSSTYGLVNGVFTEIYNVTERSYRSSEVRCFINDGPAPITRQVDELENFGDRSTLADQGPLVFVRTEPGANNFGFIKIAGFARDDKYGLNQLEFWVDGNAVDLIQLKKNQPDPFVCSEIPALSCRQNSGFEGFLNSRLLTNGPHALQIIATNNHPENPIPTYYETTIVVNNSCSETIAPQAAIQAPQQDTFVSGTQWVTTNVTDSSGVDWVKFYIDGTHKATRFDPPFEWAWNTRTYGNGLRNLKVQAFDKCGNNRVSAIRTVRVGNSCGTAPSISLTSPAAGSTVSGTATLSATTSSATGIEKVVFYVDGIVLTSDTAAPFSATWDSEAVADGSHTLQARALDLCGVGTWSNQVTITSDNVYPVALSFGPTDDTFVSEDEPTTPFGTYNFMRIRTTDGGHGRHAYLKFQVSGISGPVTSTKLRLRSQDKTVWNPGIYQMTDHSWTETTLTWNDASLAHTNVWSFNRWDPDTWYDFDITGSVTGDGIYTFAMASGTPYGLMDFWSKEAAPYAPVLEVTYLASP